jgi:hypothetical protein
MKKLRKTTPKAATPSVTVKDCEFTGVKFDANVTALLSDMVHVLQTAAGAVRETVQLFTGINHRSECMLKVARPDEDYTLISNSKFVDNGKKDKPTETKAMSFEWVAPSGAKVATKKEA